LTKSLCAAATEIANLVV